MMQTLSCHECCNFQGLSVVEAQLAEICRNVNLEKKIKHSAYQQTLGQIWSQHVHEHSEVLFRLFPNGNVVLSKHRPHKKRRLHILAPLVSWNSKFRHPNSHQFSHVDNWNFPDAVWRAPNSWPRPVPVWSPVVRLTHLCLGSKCKPCRPCRRSLSMWHPPRLKAFTAPPAGNTWWVPWRFLVEIRVK